MKEVVMSKIINKLAKGKEDEDFQSVKEVLHKITSQGSSFVVSKSREREVLKERYDLEIRAHLDVERTRDLVTREFSGKHYEKT